MRRYQTSTGMIAATACLAAVMFCTVGEPLSGPGASAPTGELRGRLLLRGGAPPGEVIPTSGVVTVRSSGSSQITLVAAADGRFSAPVSIGRYEVAGVGGACRPVVANVGRSGVVITVYCEIK